MDLEPSGERRFNPVGKFFSPIAGEIACLLFWVVAAAAEG